MPFGQHPTDSPSQYDIGQGGPECPTLSSPTIKELEKDLQNARYDHDQPTLRVFVRPNSSGQDFDEAFSFAPVHNRRREMREYKEPSSIHHLAHALTSEKPNFGYLVDCPPGINGSIRLMQDKDAKVPPNTENVRSQPMKQTLVELTQPKQGHKPNLETGYKHGAAMQTSATREQEQNEKETLAARESLHHHLIQQKIEARSPDDFPAEEYPGEKSAGTYQNKEGLQKEPPHDADFAQRTDFYNKRYIGIDAATKVLPSSGRTKSKSSIQSAQELEINAIAPNTHGLGCEAAHRSSNIVSEAPDSGKRLLAQKERQICLPNVISTTKQSPHLENQNHIVTNNVDKSISHPSTDFQLPAEEPSAEELLFLAMRRTRTQCETENRLVAEQAELKLRNDQLVAEVMAQRTKLDSSISREKRQSQEIQKYETKLRDYRTRFEKLKVWSEGMADGMKELHTQTRKFAQDLQSAQAAKEDIITQLQSMQSSSQQSNQKLAELRCQLHESSKNTQFLETERDKLLQELSRKNGRLAELDATNISLQSHVVRLRETQERFYQSLEREQQYALDQLTRVKNSSDDIKSALQELSRGPPWVENSLEMLNNLTKREFLSPHDITTMENDVQKLVQRHLSFESTTTSKLNSIMESTKIISAEAVAQVVSNVEKLCTDLASQGQITKLIQIQDGLKDPLGRLEEQAGQIKKQLALAEGQHFKTQDLLQQTNQSIGEASKRGFTALEDHRGKLAEMESRHNQKWIQVNAQLDRERKRANESLESAQEEKAANSDLRSRCDTLKSSLQDVQERLQTLDSHLKEKTSHIGNLESQLIQANSDLEASREDSRSFEERCLNHESRIQELCQELAKEKAAFENCTLQKTALTRDLEQSERKTSQLESQLSTLNEIRQTSENVPDLHMRLETQDSTISRLTAEIRGLENIQNENETLKRQQQRLEEDTSELEEQKRQVAECKKIQYGLQDKNKTLERKINELEDGLANANRYSELLSDLESQLAQKTKEIDRLNKEMTGLREASERLSAAEARALDLECQVNETIQNLNETQKEIGRCNLLQDEIRTQATEMVQLRQKFEEAEKSLKSKERIEQICQQKESCIKELQQKIAKIEQALPEIPDSNHAQQLNSTKMDRLSQKCLLSSQPHAIQQRDGNGNSPTAQEGSGVLAKSRNVYRRRADRNNSITSSATWEKQHRPVIAAKEKESDVKGPQTIPSIHSPESNSVAESPFAQDSQYRLPFGTQVTVVKETQLSPTSAQSSSSLTELEDFAEISSCEEAVGVSVGPLRTANTPIYAKQAVTGTEQAPQRQKGSQGSTSSQVDQMLLETLEHLQDHNNGTSQRNQHGRMANLDATLNQNVLRVAMDSSSVQDSPSTVVENNISSAKKSEISESTKQSNIHASDSVIKTDTLTQHTPSDTNMLLSSPASASKHLANSAAKRRNDRGEGESPHRGNNKRLRRTPGNLDVQTRSTAMQSPSGFPISHSPNNETLMPANSTMPSGAARRASVVSTHVPGPGKSRRTKAPRKGSKMDKYSTRFSR